MSGLFAQPSFIGEENLSTKTAPRHDNGWTFSAEGDTPKNSLFVELNIRKAELHVNKNEFLPSPIFCPRPGEIPLPAFIRPTFKRNGTKTHPEEELR
jgi:hypothetical protein